MAARYALADVPQLKRPRLPSDTWPGSSDVPPAPRPRTAHAVGGPAHVYRARWHLRHSGGMSRRSDFELWREVSRTTVGLSGMVELFAKRVRRVDRLVLAREMLEHADHLTAVAAHQRDEVATARVEGEAMGWREAATMLRTRRG